MRHDLAALMAARDGHFLLESGHHGNLWLDLDGLFARPALVRPLARELAMGLPPVSVVCGPLTGGGLLAQLVAEELDSGFCFAERLPDVSYRIPDALRAGLRGARVAVVDDVMNAGSAVRKTLRDLIACGAKPVAVGALLVLGSSAVALAAEYAVELSSLDAWPNDIWEPDDCPRCAKGVPLTTPACRIL